MVFSVLSCSHGKAEMLHSFWKLNSMVLDSTEAYDEAANLLFASKWV